MKPIQLGLFVAGGLLVSLWLALSVPVWAATTPQSGGPNTTPAPDVVISQQPNLVLTTTVGSSPTSCGITRTIQVRRNTVVYPCYAIENRGTTALALHRIATQRLGVITDSLPFTLAPGVMTNTIALGLVLTDVTSFDVTDLITWTARTYTNTDVPAQIVTDTDRIKIDVITPTLSIVKSVGVDRDICPATQNLRVPTGSTVYYCLTVENQGDEAFTRHELIDAPLNLRTTLVYTVPPGTTWVITPGVLADLGVSGQLQRANVTAPFTNTVTLTSTTAGGLSARSASTATIGVGTTTVVFTKTVGTEPAGCSRAGSMSLALGTPLYYCVSILNTGEVSLTRHTLREPNLAIDVTFDYTLLPGELLTITNRVLTETLGQIALFGPFNYSGAYPTVVNNTMNYSGTSTEGTTVSSSAATQVTPPPTPAPTHTPTPRPASTNTPFPTNTPGPTNTPVPPTPSLTPTFTPQTPTATPTRSYVVSALTTPTPTPLSAAAAQATAEAAAAATATMQSSIVQTDTTAPSVAPEAGADVDGGGVPDVAPDAVPDGPVAPGVPGERTLGQVPEEIGPLVGVVTGSVTPGATQAVVVIVVTSDASATPDPAATLDPLRPLVPPPPTPTPDYLLAAATAIDAMAATAGWIWFLGGSLVFFVTAGVVAGLFFRNQEEQRFDLEPWEDEDYWLPETDIPTENYDLDEDDEWPAHLP